MSDILDSDNSGLSEDNDRIIQTDLRNEMSRSYLEYAMSVIVGRALPDARDGLNLFIEEFFMQCMNLV